MKSTRTAGRPFSLSEWRERRKITLASISANTKISLRYLEAIENHKFKVLPGVAYGVSYIRQYAQAIDYDPDDLVNYYVSVVRPPDLEPETSHPPVSRIRRVWDFLRCLRDVSLHRQAADPRD